MTSCGLVVTTYQRPDALGCVLEAVATSSRLPDELVVADDGSDEATARIVAGHAARSPYPVTHAWQPHDGFRAGRIRNAAIARTRCEYIVLLDGDMVPHAEFLADHLALARRGYFSQGVRILLDATATRRVLAAPGSRPAMLSAGLGFARRAYACRAPRLARPLRTAANGIVSIKACNQGFWRDDLVAVNGFDEAMHGWGAEDKELCARLGHAGVRRQTLLCAAIAWHLDHPPASRDRAAANFARWQETRRLRRVRCAAGLDGHPVL